MHWFVLLFIIYICYYFLIICIADNSTIIGGAFDIQSFLNNLRRKYGPNLATKPINVEVEIKFKCDAIKLNKIAKWIIGQSKSIRTETTDYIWSRQKIIKTISGESTKWHTKDRLSKIDMQLGNEFPAKLTIATEQDLIEEPIMYTNYDLSRFKQRTSLQLDKYWRLDCTWVDNNTVPEIEAEYVAPDYWNALQRIKIIEKLILRLI